MDFLLLNNTNLPPILSKIAIFGYPFAFTPSPQTDGFPGTISVKFTRMSTNVKATKWRRNITKNFNWLSRAHKRHRQTDRFIQRHISHSWTCIHVR